MNKRRILVVDDHPMVRDWLAQMINREPDLAVSGEAGDAAGALEKISNDPPDMAIVDLTMGDNHGTELIREIAQRFPQVPVLVVSMHDESLYGERAIRAGAKGYITKQEAGDQIRTAIRSVLSGRIYLSDALASRMIRRAAEQSPTSTKELSDRQLVVLQLFGRGYSTAQIATEMGLSIKTVEGYIARIKAKLGLATAGELLQYAIAFNKEPRP
jgi:DNA-binding NarL/FixJ family response regulator